VNPEELAARRFDALLESARPPTGGLERGDLVAEVTPVLRLLSELSAADRANGDYESFQFRECLAVLSLVGRRLALLDLTPTAAFQIVRLALEAVEETDARTSNRFEWHTVAAALEGYVRGREERVAQNAESSATEPLTPLRIDEAAFALIVSGTHEPAALSECVDALGRAMLNADVEMAIVDLTQLGAPNQERAVAVFAADEVTKMLGGACWFTGVDDRWRAAAADAQIPLGAIRIVPDLASALASIHGELAGRAETGARLSWRALVRRFRR